MSEVEVITREELGKLLEYSSSLPTGTIVGKRWRVDVHSNCRRLGRVPADIEPEWMIRRYTDHPDPKRIGIKQAWAVDENHDVHRGNLNG